MKSIRIHPATYIFFALLVLTGYAKILLPSFLAVVFHELAHAFVAKRLGYKLNKIYILPYGACASFKEFAFKAEDEIKIAIAGPLCNFALILFCVAFWWIFPVSYLYTYLFVISNFSIAIFNLLPAFPLDGARVFIGFLSLKNKRNFALKFVSIFNVVISFVLFLLFAVSIFFQTNFSFAIISIFLFVSNFDGKFQGKYSPIFYEFSSKKQDVCEVKSIFASGRTPLYRVLPKLNKHKFNLVYISLSNGKIKVIDENTLEKFCLVNSPDKKIEDCFMLK